MGTESYPYIATQNISVGGVLAFVAGDPVPEENAKEHGYLDEGLVVPRAEYNPEDPAAEGQPLQRGEMPPHLAQKAVQDADPEEKATAQKSAQKVATKTGSKADS